MLGREFGNALALGVPTRRTPSGSSNALGRRLGGYRRACLRLHFDRCDLCGCVLDDLTPKDLWSVVVMHYREVVRTRQPLFAPARVFSPGAGYTERHHCKAGRDDTVGKHWRLPGYGSFVAARGRSAPVLSEVYRRQSAL
jgi:hypothetical protein